MSDRRMTERRSEAEGDTSSDDRRIIDRFSNTSVLESVRQIDFWTKVLLIVILSFGSYQLFISVVQGANSAGPGIMNAVLLFTTGFFIYSPRRWIRTYLINESVTNFEMMMDKLVGLIRFSSFLAALYLVIFIAKHI